VEGAPCRSFWRRAKRLTFWASVIQHSSSGYIAESSRLPRHTGGHHRVPESEIDRLFPKSWNAEILRRGAVTFRKISGRNQLFGRVVDVKYSGLLAQVRLKIGEQEITAIITADAAKEMRLKAGERAAALIKSTEVMDSAGMSAAGPNHL